MTHPKTTMFQRPSRPHYGRLLATWLLYGVIAGSFLSIAVQAARGPVASAEAPLVNGPCHEE